MTAPRGGPGRKPKDPSGQVMKVRNIRFTDEQWADVLLIGLDCLRQIISIEATYARQFKQRQKDWATALIDRDGIVGSEKWVKKEL